MNARPSGGAGRTFKSRMCTFVVDNFAYFAVTGWIFKQTTWVVFYFHASGASQRQKQVCLIFQLTLGPPRQGKGPNTHDNFDYFAVTGWNLPLVELENELENNWAI